LTLRTGAAHDSGRYQRVTSGSTMDRAPAADNFERRALALWPRLDRAALRRCNQDPERIAALVARRTSMPPEAIKSVFTMPSVSEDETRTWFG
jgi:hypothetical protein